MSQKNDVATAPSEPKLVAIYKEVGPSSHDLMYRVKRLFPGQKVGHAGTLDPLASGILVVGIGRAATKMLHQAELGEKEYEATVTLGQTSTTDDAEGEKTTVINKKIPSETDVRAVLTSFIGTIDQLPPAYSAVKVDGTRAYKLARRGQPVELKSRPAVIQSIDLVAYSWPELKIRITTGRGVYIRSLARDIGAKLGVGGFVSALERTRVGRFTKADVISLAELDQH